PRLWLGFLLFGVVGILGRDEHQLVRGWEVLGKAAHRVRSRPVGSTFPGGSRFPGGLVSRWIFTLLQGWHWVSRLASMMALSASSVMPSWLRSYQLEAPPPWLGSAQYAHCSRSVWSTCMSPLPSPGQVVLLASRVVSWSLRLW